MENQYKKMGYFQIKDSIKDLEKQLKLAKNAMNSLPGIEFIKYADLMHFDLLTHKPISESLVSQLNQRDWPLSRKEIVEIFEASQFPYTQEQIDKCKPDSEETIQKEIERYRV